MLRKVSFIAFLISIVGFCRSQPVITFEQTIRTLDTIPYGGDGNVTYKFTNTGNQDLIVSNSQGDGGLYCTGYTREPVPPGKSGFIKGRYDTKRPGNIHKSLYVTSNATNAHVVLTLRGFVKMTPVLFVSDSVITLFGQQFGRNVNATFGIENHGPGTLIVSEIVSPKDAKTFVCRLSDKSAELPLAFNAEDKVEIRVSVPDIPSERKFSREWLVFTNASAKPKRLMIKWENGSVYSPLEFSAPKKVSLDGSKKTFAIKCTNNGADVIEIYDYFLRSGDEPVSNLNSGYKKSKLKVLQPGQTVYLKVDCTNAGKKTRDYYVRIESGVQNKITLYNDHLPVEVIVK